MLKFFPNIDFICKKNKYYDLNEFKKDSILSMDLPKYEDVKNLLPKPIYEGHDDYIDCYNYTWKVAFSNLCNPYPKSGFVSPFIDTAFNGCLFMWDSAFILMFTKYADRVFPFQKTLDNFYALQHKDGFICREINEKNGWDKFTKKDPSSTGPNLLAWCEWKYYENFKDLDRLRKVYYPLRAYQNWFKKNRTWKDGSYYSSGWGCGMDNVPRLQKGYHHTFSHGKMIWNDVNFQQILNLNILIKMNEALGNIDDVSDLVEEEKFLRNLVNEKLWDNESKFYYDLWKNNEFNYVKHIGAYWSLLAKTLDEEKAKDFIAHLENENEFNRPLPIPTLSKDNPNYEDDGRYWRGGVWAPTNYMLLNGLKEYGYHFLAYKIADKYLTHIVDIYNKDLTLYENYSPEGLGKGNPAKRDFVGWTGLVPISIFFEYVLGINADVANNKIIWRINKLEKHGILNYPFGEKGVINLICKSRKSTEEEPVILIESNINIEVEIHYNNRVMIIKK